MSRATCGHSQLISSHLTHPHSLALHFIPFHRLSARPDIVKGASITSPTPILMSAPFFTPFRLVSLFALRREGLAFDLQRSPPLCTLAPFFIIFVFSHRFLHSDEEALLLTSGARDEEAGSVPGGGSYTITANPAFDPAGSAGAFAKCVLRCS